MVSHICFGSIQQSFEFESISIAIGNNVAHLTDYGCKYKYADQVTNDGKYISAK